MGMKVFLGTVVILFFASQVLLFADADILEFRAEPSPNKITLNWKTGQENEISLFHVERSLNNQDFQTIGEVTPKGNNSSYEFVDDNISRLKSIYYYRLKIINDNGTFQFSESLPVIPNVSVIKQTWGSIKALFR
jgi:hypothetical protein